MMQMSKEGGGDDDDDEGEGGGASYKRYKLSEEKTFDSLFLAWAVGFPVVFKLRSKVP